ARRRCRRGRARGSARTGTPCRCGDGRVRTRAVAGPAPSDSTRERGPDTARGLVLEGLCRSRDRSRHDVSHRRGPEQAAGWKRQRLPFVGRASRSGGSPGAVTGTVDRLVATTPTNFGVQRMLPPNAWKPDADSVLAAVAELGYDGIALGPPGYLGTRHELDVSLADRELVLVEAFLPFHFSRNDLFGEELAALQTALSLLADRAFSPFAVLSEGFREPGRWEQAGRVRGTEGERLPSARFAALVSNLHRAADACLDAGLRPVLHHHAGTLVETDYEIRRVVEAMDTDRVGLCLDTAHAWIGGADPLALVRDFGDIIRHVHVKDLSFQRLQQGTGLRHDLT